MLKSHDGQNLALGFLLVAVVPSAPVTASIILPLDDATSVPVQVVF